MKIEKFEDIIAWQKAQDLAEAIYKKFGVLRDYKFRDQICSAVVSISNNIAEGFDRKGDNELRKFLYIALGSSSEVKSMLYLAGRLGFLDEKIQIQLIEQCSEVSRLIRGFINSLDDKRLTSKRLTD